MILLTSEVDKIFIGQILNERIKVALALHHTSLSLHLGGRLNLGWAVWAVKLICRLLV